MKIGIVGAGPAGLYFAILTKKANPDAAITVYERNRVDDTFGFGVVFSDQTLDNFEAHDAESYLAITRAFAYWDDIEINFKGSRYRIGGNGFCGCSRRTLLLILYERARDLGVAFRFQTEITDIERLRQDLDLVVLADGINSRFREQFRDHFEPAVDLRPNKFAWMGSTTELDAFKFAFEETEHGVFIAHAYQYEKNASTWVFETDADTYERAGLDKLDEAESARMMERVFATHLGGHKLLLNRSMWRNFPMIRNTRWAKDNLVLLGDAKSTAHFSIGAGTKLAMEDAIALHDAFADNGTVAASLAAFESERRDEVERTQHSADVSLVFFEHLARFWRFEPIQFAFGLMTRAKAITYDNLRLRAPEFVDDVDRHFAKGVAAQGFAVATNQPKPPMFQPFRLREMELANRVVVSPMCMYSAVDGVPNDWHTVHYGARAIGGCGAPLHGDDRHFRRRTHQPRLHRTLERRAGSGVEADRRLRAHRVGGEVLHADRPRGSQGVHSVHVGRGCAPAAGRELAGRLGLTPSLFGGEPDTARADARGHGSPHPGVRSNVAAR